MRFVLRGDYFFALRKGPTRNPTRVTQLILYISVQSHSYLRSFSELFCRMYVKIIKRVRY